MVSFWGTVSNNGKKKAKDISNWKHYYGGDFRGIEEKIPYLKDLGITALWITPVYLNIGRFFDTDSYHGYWAMDFELVDPVLNPASTDHTKQVLKDLVDKLHNTGIKVILDMVVNHTGYHNETYVDYHNNKFQNNPEEEQFRPHYLYLSWAFTIALWMGPLMLRLATIQERILLPH